MKCPPGPREPLGRGQPLRGGRVDRGTAGVVGDLEAAALVARNAVHEALAVVHPDRKRLLPVPGVPRRRPEEELLLPGSPDPLSDHLRGERAQPRPAGEHEAIGRKPRPVRERDGAHGARPRPRPRPRAGSRLDRAGPGGGGAVLAALGQKVAADRLAGLPGGEVAGLGLEERAPDPGEVHLRPPPRRLRRPELLHLEPRLPEQRHRGSRVGIGAAVHPERADPVVDPPAPAALVVAPERERADHHLHVHPLAAVDAPDDSGLAARARARVSGSPGVQQGDPEARPAEKQRGPAAERAHPHHRDVPGHAGHRASAAPAPARRFARRYRAPPAPTNAAAPPATLSSNSQG